MKKVLIIFLVIISGFLLHSGAFASDTRLSNHQNTDKNNLDCNQPNNIMDEILQAGRGCCSYHGGMSGRCSGGRVVCNDGSLSPSCKCLTSDPDSVES